jgi:predicted esterase
MADTAPEPGVPHAQPEEDERHGRLSFRPGPPAAPPGRQGLVALDAGGGTALAHVPPAVEDGPVRLVLLLHGAGGSARQGLDLLRPVADAHGLLLVAPQSARPTWDVITGGYGPDVLAVDALLAEVAAAYPVSALSVGGFSDGASYALSLGIANGDVFDSVVAFSPGFTAALVQHGRPRVYVSHGTMDTVLPVARCSRRLVPLLQQQGYPVTYEEFEGGHVVPAAAVQQAAAWLDGPPAEGAGRGGA